MIIYTKGWTAKDATTTPLVFNTKDIFYVKELSFSSKRSRVVLRWWRKPGGIYSGSERKRAGGQDG